YLNVLNHLRDERRFREFAVQLFAHLAYREVTLSQGTGEAGKDLVFDEQNRMGERECVGVQAKVGDINANAQRQTGSIAVLLNQTFTAFNSQVIFGGTRHDLDKYVIMTSGTISPEARKQIHDFARERRYGRVYVWGQEKIADVKVHYA